MDMSSLFNLILADVKQAMKEKEKSKLETLRTLHSEIKNLAIDQKKEIDDESVLSVILKNIKQKKEALEMFHQGGREDLIAEESLKLKYLESYLPEQISEEEVKAKISAWLISKNEEKNTRMMGMIMKDLMPELKGKVDSKQLNLWIKEMLEA
jgi:uncharacterized protein